ncbi:MAG: lytic murein transglycosylase [Actinomycetota bacterium]
MLRRLISLALASALLLTLLPAGVARAQDDPEDEEVVEPSYYGDAEFIETLRGYGMLDDWIAASPVSAEASVLAVSSSGYLTQRGAFLRSLDTWASRTELVRSDLARLDAAQAHVDLVRVAAVSVREALGTDDRLSGPRSETLATIEAALDSLATFAIDEPSPAQVENPRNQAETELIAIRDRLETELDGLNGSEPAMSSSGVTAFVGFDALQSDLYEVERLIQRGRDLLRPAQEEAERLATAALKRIPELHQRRMLEATDVAGLSVVTVDAYITAAQGVACPVDWALLAAIGKIESNHGRLGGATVSATGQVSADILGPLLDGGATAREAEAPVEDEVLDRRGVRRRIAAAVLTRPILLGSWLASFHLAQDLHDAQVAADEEEGNGFAVIVDSDGGVLDGNDQWDRAVGPMQFLPETWSKWATDGNGDGVSDPHNLYDAAASAARFLCHLRETRGSSPSRYLLGYNDSGSYVRKVLSTAENLRATLLPEV